MEIGHIIAQLRADRNISQRQLASALNVSPGVVGLWETNKRLPSYECIISIADFFAISTDLLFEKDRKLTPINYLREPMSETSQKILDTFKQLSEDNQDILIGEAKKLLKQQRLEEKSGALPMRQAK